MFKCTHKTLKYSLSSHICLMIVVLWKRTEKQKEDKLTERFSRRQVFTFWCLRLCVLVEGGSQSSAQNREQRLALTRCGDELQGVRSSFVCTDCTWKRMVADPVFCSGNKKLSAPNYVSSYPEMRRTHFMIQKATTD